MTDRNVNRSGPSLGRLLYLAVVLPGLLLAMATGQMSACDDGSSQATPDWDGWTPNGCVPDCYLKQCGNDGCGGSCGDCSTSKECNTSFQCVEITTTPDATNGDTSEADAGADSGADVPPDLPPPSGTDTDNDGQDDNLDNCPTVYNPTQSDFDLDKVGDACDPDIDDDGYINDLDCEPADAKVNSGMAERCDGIDNNCDSVIDGEGSIDCTDFFVDGDNDGAGDTTQMRCLCAPEAPHLTSIAGDCNDGNPALSPLVAEICDNIDNDCNLLVDDGCDDDLDGYCDKDMQMVGTPTICPLGGNDCYDYSAAVHPGANEISGDDVDNDCDGTKLGDGGGGPLVQPTCTGLCTGKTQGALLCALELCYGPDVFKSYSVTSPTNSNITNSYIAVNRFGSTSNDLAPFAGSSYVLLATGPATGTSHSTSLGGISQADPHSSDGLDAHDVVELKFTLQAPPGATGFSIDYVFFSEEYEEFIGDVYNDKFYMIIEAPSVDGGAPTVINYTDCNNPSSYSDFIDSNGQPRCYIAINTAFSEACTNPATNIDGTGYECASSPLVDGSATGSSTGWLQTTWVIPAGETFDLTFHIHDTSDGIYDSQVILDNFRWEGGTVQSGTSSHN